MPDAVILETERLHLRPITLDDAPNLFPALSDEETMRYWSCGPKTSVKEVREYLQWNVENEKVECFAITRKQATAEALGWVILHHEKEGVADIGFILCPAGRGQGFGREAAAEVMRHGFETRSLRRIGADVDPDNLPSTRCLESLGMQLEGRLRATWNTHIGVRDSLIYSRLASD
ncbi:MAG: ribosomal-protein-alanine N-acetyltransferase [Planctomycetota bacterium]|jgi:ribosomal-protein-alanine N-acetyltransferase